MPRCCIPHYRWVARLQMETGILWLNLLWFFNVLVQNNYYAIQLHSHFIETFQFKMVNI